MPPWLCRAWVCLSASGAWLRRRSFTSSCTEKGLSLVGKLPQLRPDLVGGAGQLGMALSSLLAAGGDELRTVGRIGIDQLLLLRDLGLVGRDQLFLLQLRADAFRNLRDGLSLAISRQAVPRGAM